MSDVSVATWARQISRGFSYLLSLRNQDGGIPALQRNDVSGCWTTAEAVDFYLTSGTFEHNPTSAILPSVKFLLSTQMRSGNEEGGWPILAGGDVASTMATGHAVACLSRARVFLLDDTLTSSLDAAIRAGTSWLERTQNLDGGWGVSPSGGADGVRSRMIATVYAARGFIGSGRSSNTSLHLGNACRWIRRCQQADGGFTTDLTSKQSDADSTARAVIVLKSSGAEPQGSVLLEKAISHILSVKQKQSLWSCATETFVPTAGQGQTIYNDNTLYDVAEAFAAVSFEGCGEDFREIVEYVAVSQLPDGSWHLCCPGRKDESIVTWATSEYLSIMNEALATYLPVRVLRLERTLRVSRIYWRAALISSLISALLLICLVSGLSRKTSEEIFGVGNAINSDIAKWIVGTVIVGLLINLSSSYIYDRYKKQHT